MKTPFIEELLDYFVVQKKHHSYRQEAENEYALAETFAEKGYNDVTRSIERLRYVLEKEQPVVFENERIAFLRTVRTIPKIHTEAEDKALHEIHAFHENGAVFNMAPDFEHLLEEGLDQKKAKIEAQLKLAETDEQKECLQSMLDVIAIVADFTERYRQEALRVGNNVVAEMLAWVPYKQPRTLQEAMQFLRIIHYCMWCNGNYHNTIGRIDQFLYPYYKKDLENGVLNKDSALELLEEFFISFNKDSDMYLGIQQGDNGQTIVLGGSNVDGSDAFNDLSELCLIASRDLCLIDPKVNLRVHKNTTMEVYELATTLTKKGLGFPQYTNDEIVIPALLKLGYDPEDAYNYTLAACWEILVVGHMDLVNWDSMNYLKAVQEAIEKLESCDTYEAFAELVHQNIIAQAEALMELTKNVYKEPSPLVSIMCPGCIEKMQDISKPGKYNTYGFHGDGLSSAADSMAAIKKYVYEEKTFTPTQMLAMLENDFKDYPTEQNMLRYEAPKMGNDDDYVDDIAVDLLDWYADALEGKKNDRGGYFRAGTASAMYYIWHSKDAGASPDGRNAGEALACNYSPSLFARCEGPISILKSFTKPNLKRVANGGPLTIELADTMFKNEEAIQKCAMFVKSYMDMGGHQIQINAVNRDRMLDAQKHPENYRNMIVRVWGWSGYFVELNEVYQNHIIKRSEMAL